MTHARAERVRSGFLLLAAVSVVIGTAVPADAQNITVYGTSRDPAVSAALAVLERDAYLLIDRDTVLGPEVEIAGDLIVVRARVALEGKVTGAVVVADGDFFTRSRSEVGGPVAVLGTGGAFTSGLAQGDPPRVLEQDPRVFVSVGATPTGYSLTITSPEPPPTFRLPGFYGFAPPTHDRVDGFSVIWRPDIGFGGGDTATVAIRGTVIVRTLRRRIDGTIEASYRPTPRSLVSTRVGRATFTPEVWARGDLANTLSSLIKGSDVRDYFESDVASISIRRLPPPPLIEGEGFIVPGITLRVSRDRSLEGRHPWSLMGDLDRPNPSIDEGTLASLVGRVDAAWRGARARLGAEAAVEWGVPSLGDFEFAQLSSAVVLSTEILNGHQIGITGYALVPLGDGAVPRQRWSFVGGPATLPTFPTAYARGDHLLFGNAVYLLPVNRIRIPIAGSPSIRLEYLAGTAWPSGEPMPRMEQNVGAGIQLLMFKAMVYADPAADTWRGELVFGARLSGGLSVPTF